jgi:hypothetical protein
MSLPGSSVPGGLVLRAVDGGSVPAPEGADLPKWPPRCPVPWPGVTFPASAWRSVPSSSGGASGSRGGTASGQ